MRHLNHRLWFLYQKLGICKCVLVDRRGVCGAHDETICMFIIHTNILHCFAYIRICIAVVREGKKRLRCVCVCVWSDFVQCTKKKRVYCEKLLLVVCLTYNNHLMVRHLYSHDGSFCMMWGARVEQCAHTQTHIPNDHVTYICYVVYLMLKFTPIYNF